MDATLLLHLAQATNDAAKAAGDAKNEIPVVWAVIIGLAGAAGTVLAALIATRSAKKQAAASIEAAKTAGDASIQAANAAARAAVETRDKDAFGEFQAAKRVAYTTFKNAAWALGETESAASSGSSGSSGSSRSSKSERRAVRVGYAQSLSLVNNGLAYPETRAYLKQFEVPPGATDGTWKQVAEAIGAQWDELSARLEHDIGMVGPWR
jgi:hypothetical protein